jgi:hypothetical protein
MQVRPVNVPQLVSKSLLDANGKLMEVLLGCASFPMTGPGTWAAKAPCLGTMKNIRYDFPLMSLE